MAHHNASGITLKRPNQAPNAANSFTSPPPKRSFRATIQLSSNATTAPAGNCHNTISGHNHQTRKGTKATITTQIESGISRRRTSTKAATKVSTTGTRSIHDNNFGIQKVCFRESSSRAKRLYSNEPHRTRTTDRVCRTAKDGTSTR